MYKFLLPCDFCTEMTFWDGLLCNLLYNIKQEVNDRSSATTWLHFCDLMWCLHDVFMCAINLGFFLSSAITFLNCKTCVSIFWCSLWNKIFTLETLTLVCYAFCLRNQNLPVDVFLLWHAWFRLELLGRSAEAQPCNILCVLEEGNIWGGIEQN